MRGQRCGYREDTDGKVRARFIDIFPMRSLHPDLPDIRWAAHHGILHRPWFLRQPSETVFTGNHHADDTYRLRRVHLWAFGRCRYVYKHKLAVALGIVYATQER